MSLRASLDVCCLRLTRCWSWRLLSECLLLIIYFRLYVIYWSSFLLLNWKDRSCYCLRCFVVLVYFLEPLVKCLKKGSSASRDVRLGGASAPMVGLLGGAAGRFDFERATSDSHSLEHSGTLSRLFCYRGSRSWGCSTFLMLSFLCHFCWYGGSFYLYRYSWSSRDRIVVRLVGVSLHRFPCSCFVDDSVSWLSSPCFFDQILNWTLNYLFHFSFVNNTSGQFCSHLTSVRLGASAMCFCLLSLYLVILISVFLGFLVLLLCRSVAVLLVWSPSLGL